MKNKVVFISWDWKEQPDWDEIQKAVNAVFDGSHAPCIAAVEGEDWGIDCDCAYFVVISSIPIPKNLWQSLGQQWNDLDDETYELQVFEIEA